MPGSTGIDDLRLFTANEARASTGVIDAPDFIVIAADGRDMSVEIHAGDVLAIRL